MRNLLSALTVLSLLAGCDATGWPLAHRPDPGVSDTLRAAEPLVGQCRTKLLAWLGQRPVTIDEGPTVTRTGDITTIQIEAQSTAPDAIDPIEYRCEFEGGTMSKAGPV